MARYTQRTWYILTISLTLASVLAFLYIGGGTRTSPTLYTSHDRDHHSLSSPILEWDARPGELYFPAVKSHYKLNPPDYNLPSTNRPRTPLFIGFTRNHAMLYQTVLSYIAAGWPRSDIIVIDNSGTMDANNRGQLSSANPFSLDYNLLRTQYGVSVLQTPTLLTFAQLQNFYLRVAIAHGWKTFFWSHMDVVVLSDEEAVPYRSFYERVLDVVAECAAKPDAWAVKWFAYDWLTYVNVDAWRKIGAWDPFVPYYGADCDAYSRMVLSGYGRSEADVSAGHIFDVADVLPDVEGMLFAKPGNAEDGGDEAPGSERYRRLKAEPERLQTEKGSNPGGRNTWHLGHNEGTREPWTYDVEGSEKAFVITIGAGWDVYGEKWGTRECNLDAHNVSLTDMWTSVHQS